MGFWHKLSLRTRLLAVTGFVGILVAAGAQFHVSSQGDRSSTYPKGYRGGTCTIETEALMVGYSAYFIPNDYEIPDDPSSAKQVPVLCGKVPSPGTLNVTLDLLHPESARYAPLGLRLVRLSEQNTEHELLSVPPQAYRSGTLTQAFKFDAQGNTCSISMENNRTRRASMSRYRSRLARTGETMQQSIGCKRLYSFSSFSFSPTGKEYLADRPDCHDRNERGNLVPREVSGHANHWRDLLCLATGWDGLAAGPHLQ